MSQLTDGCTSGACTAALNAANSLDQGRTFAVMNAKYHGGRRSSRRTNRHKNRKSRRQNGGMADYPNEFSGTLPSDMHAAADISKLDTAFAQLPAFAGKYGMSGGSRATRRSQA